jgi:sec-independent protein translocase protein TatA
VIPNIGPMEIALVLIVALIILGPKKLPDMGRSVGKGMREFKAAISGDGDKEDVPSRLASAARTDEPSERPAA